MSDSKRDRRDLRTASGVSHGKQRRLFRGKIQVPVGLEKALFHAACNEEFKKRLLADPRAAIEQTGITLRPSELAMLAAVPSSTLEDMIDRVVPENPKKRKFMGLVANAAASLAAGTVLVSCEHDTARSGGADGDTSTGTEEWDDSGTGTKTDDGGTQTETGSGTETSTTTTTSTGTGTGTGTTGTATESDTVETSNPDTTGGGGGMAPDVGGH